MLSYHILRKGDGAECADSIRGVVTYDTEVYYRVEWEDGTASEHECGDPAVWGYDFPQIQGMPTGLDYKQIRHDGRQWAAAGPRPCLPPIDAIIPIEADARGYYGYPKKPDA